MELCCGKIHPNPLLVTIGFFRAGRIPSAFESVYYMKVKYFQPFQKGQTGIFLLNSQRYEG